MASPKYSSVKGGCYSCSIPPNQASCYQIYNCKAPDLTRCKCEKVNKKILAREFV
jgi:hypothetical protein